MMYKVEEKSELHHSDQANSGRTKILEIKPTVLALIRATKALLRATCYIGDKENFPLNANGH